MKRIILIFTIALSLGSISAFGQVALWNLNYEVSFPTGETVDYIGSASFRGGAIEGRGLISENISIGGWVSWEVFFEKLDQSTYNRGGLDVTGVQVRYLNMVPVLVTSHYYFGDFSGATPYLGLGTGAYKIEQRTEMGLIAVVDKNWHFGFTPEFGAFIPVNTDFGLNVSARYNYAIKSNDSINYSYLSLSIGFAFLEW
jgi:opacity protein-like surface antigen